MQKQRPFGVGIEVVVLAEFHVLFPDIHALYSFDESERVLLVAEEEELDFLSNYQYTLSFGSINMMAFFMLQGSMWFLSRYMISIGCSSSISLQCLPFRLITSVLILNYIRALR